MSKEVFIEYMKAYQKGLSFLENMHDEGLDLYETSLCTSADALFQAWLDQIMDNEGQDLVYWWLFEDVDKVITEDNTDINVESLEDFANYLNEYGYI